MTDRELRAIRGAQIAMIFQDPLSSLHPYYKVGWQIVEMIRAHDRRLQGRGREPGHRAAAAGRHPQARGRRVDDYPHQFSGGMRQRAMIAMAMALNPILLIADEPTTALDVTVQAQVLDVMERLQSEFGTAIIMITHDLGVIADIADDVVVMYAGTAMEKAERRELFYHNHHPYTEGLLASHARSRAPTGRSGCSPSTGRRPASSSCRRGARSTPAAPTPSTAAGPRPPPLAPVHGRADHLLRLLVALRRDRAPGRARARPGRPRRAARDQHRGRQGPRRGDVMSTPAVAPTRTGGGSRRGAAPGRERGQGVPRRFLRALRPQPRRRARRRRREPRAAQGRDPGPGGRDRAAASRPWRAASPASTRSRRGTVDFDGRDISRLERQPAARRAVARSR